MIEERLLCATDGSAVSEKAVAYTIGLALQTGQPATFLLVADGDLATTPQSWDEAKLKTGDLPPDRELIAALQMAIQQEFIRLRLVRAFGPDPAEAIVTYAERNGYRHIIMGSAGLTGARRMLLGSVAADVVTRAHCPVTIVR
ncbi:MAG TPA: universal stress protein [Alphaproteobacteria bacterium]|nr:universal stress protein [Alphaproteobacteria bacterium]